jgi:hypothetical protein
MQKFSNYKNDLPDIIRINRTEKILTEIRYKSESFHDLFRRFTRRNNSKNGKSIGFRIQK